MTRRPALLVLVPPAWIGGLGTMRSLGQLGVPVYGLAHRRRLVPNASRYCAGTFPIGDEGRPTGEPATLVAGLLAAGEQLGPGAILLAGTDEWAVFVAEHAEQLQTRFRFPRMSADLVASLASKEGLYQLAGEHNVPTPRIAKPANAQEAAALASTLRYPVMLKPVVSRPDVTFKAVAGNADSLLAAYERMEEAPEAPNVMLQEYIPGRDEDVWMFNGYFDENSRCLAAFTGRKLRQQPAHMGHCSLGVCRQNRAVIKTTLRFLGAVGYRGIVDIGYRFDHRDGQYKILDVNPRLGGAFRLFVDRNGLDVVRALYLDLTDQPVPVTVPQDGRRWLREDSELLSLVQYRRTDKLRLGDWLRSFRGVQETATFSLVDPVPFIASMWHLVSETVRGRWQRVRRRQAQASAQRPAARIESTAAVK
ncbi:MAG TPA: ATP-grasp domain-containing protein [Candidatus Dormibacteraeota bacterium]|nr:ATP-grasp domain-containing protein [Candidatus Dormibacteraeota bacterium]